jgi:hypothetical protein
MVEGLWLRVHGSKFRIKDLGFMVRVFLGQGFMSLGLRVKG